MRVHVWLGGVLFAVILALPALGQRGRSPAEKIANGFYLFHLRGCINCHAVEGEGGKVGPDLSRWKTLASPVLMAAIMWNHLPGMAERHRREKLPWPTLEGEDLGDIFAYIHSLSKAQGATYAFPGDAEEGKRIFRREGCVRCHRMPFEGGGEGPDLGDAARFYRSEVYLATRMIRHGPKMLELARKKGISWPRLEGNEIAHLFAFLKSVAEKHKKGP